MSADGGSENDLDVDFAAESFHHDSASDNVGLSGGGEDIDFDSFAEHDGTLHDHLLAQVGERFTGLVAIVAGQPVALIDEAGSLRADLAELATQPGVQRGLDWDGGVAGKYESVPVDLGCGRVFTKKVQTKNAPI